MRTEKNDGPVSFWPRRYKIPIQVEIVVVVVVTEEEQVKFSRFSRQI